MTIFIKVKESKDDLEINNLTNEHYDVTDDDFINYDADDELEAFYIYDVIEVQTI